jgi:hypothetical protein
MPVSVSVSVPVSVTDSISGFVSRHIIINEVGVCKLHNIIVLNFVNLLCGIGSACKTKDPCGGKPSEREGGENERIREGKEEAGVESERQRQKERQSERAEKQKSASK